MLNDPTQLPSVCLVEFSSIAVGIKAGDALVKDAPVAGLYAGTVHPGRYLLLAVGDMAAVEIGYHRALDAGGDTVIDHMLLADIHSDAVEAMTADDLEIVDQAALGVLETATVAAAIRSADQGTKQSVVTVDAIRLADGLGGKGVVLFSGTVQNVEAAIEVAADEARTSGALLHTTVIPQLHADMRQSIGPDMRFRKQLQRAV